MGAAREHGILDALREAQVKVIADNGYRGAGFVVPQRRRPADPDTGGRRRLSRNQKAVNSAHARQRSVRQRPAQELEGPLQDSLLPAPRTSRVKAVLVLILAG
jgi:IS5 family transposase